MKKIVFLIILILLSSSIYGITLSDKLIDAIENNDINLVNDLIDEGADLNPINYYLGKGPLISVCLAGNIEIVKILIDKGADVNATNEYDSTALISVSFFPRNYPEIMKYLVQQGADVNAKNNFGYTALIMVSIRGNLEGVKYLVTHGANINIKRKYGNTALIYAAKDGDLKMVKYLIKMGAYINIKNKNGYTALMFASENGHLGIVEYLKSKGARLTESRPWLRIENLNASKYHIIYISPQAIKDKRLLRLKSYLHIITQTYLLIPATFLFSSSSFAAICSPVS